MTESRLKVEILEVFSQLWIFITISQRLPGAEQWMSRAQLWIFGDLGFLGDEDQLAIFSKILNRFHVPEQQMQRQEQKNKTGVKVKVRDLDCMSGCI